MNNVEMVFEVEYQTASLGADLSGVDLCETAETRFVEFPTLEQARVEARKLAAQSPLGCANIVGYSVDSQGDRFYAGILVEVKKRID